MTALLFDQVSFAYDREEILRSVSVEVAEGEFIGVIGPNGGGKTTFLKLALGFLTPQLGSIKIFDEPPRQARNQVAYVPQILRFDKQFPLSVLDLVLQGRLSHLHWWGGFSAEDHTKAMESLDHVGLLGFKDQPFGSLSGGQTQRALIARALVSEPKLLFLDEPTASVDAAAEGDIYAMLKQLKGSMTILMVTHDVQTVVDTVDRVLCLQTTAMSLSPEEVCAHFAFGLYHPPLINISDRSK